MSKSIGNEITLEQIDEFFTIGKKVTGVVSVPTSCARPERQKHKNLVHANPAVNRPVDNTPVYKPKYQR